MLLILMPTTPRSQIGGTDSSNSNWHFVAELSKIEGAWLAWPFDLMRFVVTGLLPAMLPGFALTLNRIVIAAVAVVVLYLALVYSPGGAREPPVPRNV